jgi:hypothetical protein
MLWRPRERYRYRVSSLLVTFDFVLKTQNDTIIDGQAACSKSKQCSHKKSKEISFEKVPNTFSFGEGWEEEEPFYLSCSRLVTKKRKKAGKCETGKCENWDKEKKPRVPDEAWIQHTHT